MNTDFGYFPGHVRKCLTFSIDDGNVRADRKFISAITPAGIKGTFNLVPDNLEKYTKDYIRGLYGTYGVANHTVHHPHLLEERYVAAITDEPFCESCADPEKIYRVPGTPGLLLRRHPQGWRYDALIEDYMRFVDEGKRRIEDIFGVGSVTGFVYPFFRQPAPVPELIRARGYRDIRRTGPECGKDGFSMPDPMDWVYTVGHDRLSEVSERYFDFPDDGEMKFFCLGVHSSDYDSDDGWARLGSFVGSAVRHSGEYYTDTVAAIFAYATAASAACSASDSSWLVNPADIAVYVKCDGEPRVLPPHSNTRLSR